MTENDTQVERPDFRVRNEGTLFLVYPMNANAAGWLDEHIDPEESTRFGGALVVEHGYIRDLVIGIQDSGFIVH